MLERPQIMTDTEGPVLTCHKSDCSYNEESCCYAGAIEVGDSHPSCDTYTHANVSRSAEQTCVSACQVTECFFNSQQDCHAAGVTIGDHSGHADCFTERS